jgi:hypothetical protein
LLLNEINLERHLELDKVFATLDIAVSRRSDISMKTSRIYRSLRQGLCWSSLLPITVSQCRWDVSSTITSAR